MEGPNWNHYDTYFMKSNSLQLAITGQVQNLKLKAKFQYTGHSVNYKEIT